MKLKIDTSACHGVIAVSDLKLHDTWYYRDLTLKGGKIYALVSEYGQGCQYLSYLLGGKIRFGDIRIFLDDTEIRQKDLQKISHNLEPSGEAYQKYKVRKAVEKVLKSSPEAETFPELAEKFLLTPERYDRQFRYLSGERWRASAAYGFAMRKKIFYAPYKTSCFYYQMCQTGLLKAFRELTASGAVILLPAGSDEFLKYIADEIFYLNRQYDPLQLQDSERI